MPLSAVEVSPIRTVTLPQVSIDNLVSLCKTRLKDLPEGQDEVKLTYEVALKALENATPQYFYKVEVLRYGDYITLSEECTYEDGLRRFGHDNPLRFTRL